MRAVVQRVSHAKVVVEGEVVGEIQEGLMVLIGVQRGDSDSDVSTLVEKLAGLRVFEDSEGKMNLPITDTGGAILAVSQFTLLGDARKGRRPSFITAADPETGNRLYESVVAGLRARQLVVETGRFQTDMKVHLVNDGPVTILLDTRKLF